MDRTYFIWILPATAKELTSTTAVDWHLRVTNKKCNVGLMKNYCITVSIQKISSIHNLIQQILESHELNDQSQFWPGPPKNHWNNFLLSWICTTMQKISSFHQFIHNFRVPWPDCPHPFLTMPIQKNFDQLLIYVNLYQHAKN